MASNLIGGDTRNVSLEQLVQECTDEILTEPDYSKQLDIVERVQAFGSSYVTKRCKEVADAIASRLDKKRKSENVVYLSLHLADFCLKNLHPNMGMVMAQDSFQKAIVKLAKGKTAKGRAAVLLVCKVQEWAYMFQNHRGFQETYLALQKMGFDFPPPTRELMEQQSRMNEERIRRAEDKKAREKAANDPWKQMKDSLKLLHENVMLVKDMIYAVDVDRGEDVRQNELVAPLLESIGQHRKKIEELIGTVTDEDTLMMLLTVNDDINSAFDAYSDVVAGRRPQRRHDIESPSSASSSARTSRSEPAPQSPVPSGPPPVYSAQAPVVAYGVPSGPPPVYAATLAPPPAYTSQPQVIPVAQPQPVVDNDPFAALARARHAKEQQQRSQQSRPAPAPAPGSSSSSLDNLFLSTPSNAPTTAPLLPNSLDALYNLPPSTVTTPTATPSVTYVSSPSSSSSYPYMTNSNSNNNNNLNNLFGPPPTSTPPSALFPPSVVSSPPPPVLSNPYASPPVSSVPINPFLDPSPGSGTLYQPMNPQPSLYPNVPTYSTNNSGQRPF